jgi:GT2 family glycosyltransferase
MGQVYPNIEIIVVDNASSDNSLSLLAEYRQVKVIPLEENLGFTGACNVGLLASNADIKILLNNDTTVDANWINVIVTAFEQHPEVGLIASKMLLYDQRDIFHNAGDYVALDGLAHNRGVWQKDTGQYDLPAYVFSACGGSAAYRQSMLDEVGLLDSDFFFSFEDVDLAWRACLMGWRCLYVPQALVYHKLKASGGGVTASFYDGRNRIYTLIKNYPSDLWKLYKWQVVVAQVRLFGDALRLWRGAAARATMHGILAGILGMRKMFKKRKEIQSKRVVSAHYLQRLMTPPYQVPVHEDVFP